MFHAKVVNMRNLYIIERRNEKGELVFADPRPEQFFGMKAIHGINYWEMSQVIYRLCPDAHLDGASICEWPRHVHPQFVARVKYW